MPSDRLLALPTSKTASIACNTDEPLFGSRVEVHLVSCAPELPLGPNKQSAQYWALLGWGRGDFQRNKFTFHSPKESFPRQLAVCASLFFSFFSFLDLVIAEDGT